MAFLQALAHIGTFIEGVFIAIATLLAALGYAIWKEQKLFDKKIAILEESITDAFKVKKCIISSLKTTYFTFGGDFVDASNLDDYTKLMILDTPKYIMNDLNELNVTIEKLHERSIIYKLYFSDTFRLNISDLIHFYVNLEHEARLLVTQLNPKTTINLNNATVQEYINNLGFSGESYLQQINSLEEIVRRIENECSSYINSRNEFDFVYTLLKRVISYVSPLINSKEQKPPQNDQADT